MADIRWYAMPVGFFSQLAVVLIKTKYKAEGMGVVAQLLDLIANSPGGRVRGALKESSDNCLEVDALFAEAVAGISGSSAEVVSGVVISLLESEILEPEGTSLCCRFILDSLKEQADRRVGARQRQRDSRHSRVTVTSQPCHSDVTVTSQVSHKPVTNMSQPCHKGVTGTYIHTDIPTDRQTDRNGSAALGNLGQTSAALLSKIQTNGRC